jgi:hypothetical protein
MIKTFHFKDRIEVFGSNRAGRHGKGHAATAKRYYGAEMGVGEGLTGRSYALPTKDENIKTLPLEAIAEHVARFHDVVLKYPDKDFFVARVGCGLAGYDDADIAPLFAEHDWPDHVHLPGIWQPYIDKPNALHRIIVAGGRDFTDIKLMYETLDRQLGKLIERGKHPIIVSGTARGADQMGEQYAKDRGLDIIRFPAPWNEFKEMFGNNKAAGFVRNAMMAQYATVLSAFWDGRSKGTESMIELANNFKLTVRTTAYTPEPVQKPSVQHGISLTR